MLFSTLHYFPPTRFSSFTFDFYEHDQIKVFVLCSLLHSFTLEKSSRMSRITRSMSNAITFKSVNITQVPTLNQDHDKITNVVAPYKERDCCKEKIKQNLEQTKWWGSKDLYTNHVIKNEMALGPTVLQLSIPQLQYNTTVTADKPTCDICKKKFKYKSSLTRHLSLHTREKPFVCHICDMKFSQKSHLGKHLSNHDGDKLSGFHNYKEFTEFIHPCFYNGLHYNTKKLKYKSNKIFTQESHLQSLDVIKQYTCVMCHKIFKQRSLLISHLRIHDSTKFICDLCKKVFRYKATLINHIYTHNISYNCEICNKNFIHEDTLIRHLRLHSGEKPFACKICKLKFSFKYTLTRHINNHIIHTRQKSNAIKNKPNTHALSAIRCVSTQSQVSGPWRFVELDADDANGKN